MGKMAEDENEREEVAIKPTELDAAKSSQYFLPVSEDEGSSVAPVYCTIHVHAPQKISQEKTAAFSV